MKSETWTSRNQTHITLSDNTAEHYDNDYAENNYQTRQYMQFEEGILKNAVSLVPNKKLAIDLGCGTGRDLFQYANDFNKAIGWDFSPKMVSVTRQKAENLGYSNVSVEERDVEKVGFAGIEDNSVNFINAGFGMGSFIEDLPAFLAKVHCVLSSDGIFMATFYNKHSIAQYISSPCFAAIPDTNNNTLTVTAENSSYVIPCISYSVEELVTMFSPKFQLIHTITYPSISTLLSREVLSVPEVKSAVLELEDKVKECLLGHYIILVCRKN